MRSLLPASPVAGVRRALGGAPPSYSSSANWRDGVFRNRLPSTVVSGDDRGSILREAISRSRARAPRIELAEPRFPEVAADCAATWLGHSSVLLEVGGHRILADPVFSDRVSPSATVGPRRLHPAPIGVSDLPTIDVVLVSHDHYDHLDMATVDALAPTGVTFVVPLGVGAHLRAWGVADGHIVELDWGQTHRLGDLEVRCTEARHFSGRLFRRNQTLWSSWVVRSGERRVLFGGDSGYTPAFKELADLYDGFDLTVLPIGAYDRRWADIHMDPADAVQTHLDVRGEVLLPIHWATFNLAFHPWAEPVEWALREAAERGVTVATPRLGERFHVDDVPTEPWWR